MPSNHGSPIPIGIPQICSSTALPIESKFIRFCSTISIISFAVAGSIHLISRHSFVAHFCGQSDIGGELISPIDETWAFTLMFSFSIIGKTIAAAATIGAVSLALDVPPPRKSALPSVFFIITIS